MINTTEKVLKSIKMFDALDDFQIKYLLKKSKLIHIDKNETKLDKPLNLSTKKGAKRKIPQRISK